MQQSGEFNAVRLSASQVLDAQSDLVNRLRDEDSDFSYMIEKVMLTNFSSRRAAEPSIINQRNAKSIPRLAYTHIREATAFRVSADMVDLTEYSAALLDDTDRFYIRSAPADFGFVRLDRPFVITDIRGGHMFVHALSWGHVSMHSDDSADPDTVLLVTMWNDLDVEPDVYSDRILKDFGSKYQQMAGRWSFIGSEILYDEQRVGPPTINPSHIHENMPHDAVNFTNPLRFISALFMMLNQNVTVMNNETPNRAAQKRAQRMGVVSPTSDVTVISLRQRRHHVIDDEPAGKVVNWTCRWPVRGHWRWARVGPGRQQLERVWVSATIKGPADKPLRVSRKLYDL